MGGRVSNGVSRQSHVSAGAGGRLQYQFGDEMAWSGRERATSEMRHIDINLLECKPSSKSKVDPAAGKCRRTPGSQGFSFVCRITCATRLKKQNNVNPGWIMHCME